MNDTFTIATISQETGIAKEVLRKWEMRYGFPQPLRNAVGRRRYSTAQVHELKQIKTLVDGGMRPGQVVPLDEQQRNTLLAQLRQATSIESPSQIVANLLKILQDKNPDLLRDKLKQQLLRLGLRQFILDVIQPLNTMVGAAWAENTISVREEHIYTTIIQSILYEEIGKLSMHGGAPRVALMTVPDETHTLGILMVEAMVLMNGGTCISLGTQIPLDQIVPTVQDYQINVVGLSFSAAFPKRRMAALLKTIRQMLPTETALWVGGAGVAGLHKSPKGVIAFNDLGEIDTAIAQLNLKR